MPQRYWEQVQRTGFEVPHDRDLDDLTAELTVMLGSPDPAVRDGLAYPALATWIEGGVYDDLLAGLGDGMAAGLLIGLGETETDTVFRRSFSALILAECIQRDNHHHLVPGGQVLAWGDHLMTWLLGERDVRGFVRDKGWAHTIAHGADALAALAQSPRLADAELAVLLDVIRERTVLPGTPPLLAGEPDRLALAVLQVLRRNALGIDHLESWVEQVSYAANPYRLDVDGDPYADAINPQALLRSLFVTVSLVPDPPPVRPDLLLIIIEALRTTNAPILTSGT